MDSIKDYDIAGTLDFGIRLNKRFFMLLTLDFFILAITCLTPLIVYVFYDFGLDIGSIIALIVASTTFFAGVLITVIIYIKQEFFFKHRVGEFLNDPLLYETKSLISEFSSEGSGWYARYRVTAEFLYGDERKIVIGKKYCKQFYHYIGKEVPILYSPKYDQVMILKKF